MMLPAENVTRSATVGAESSIDPMIHGRMLVAPSLLCAQMSHFPNATLTKNVKYYTTGGYIITLNVTKAFAHAPTYRESNAPFGGPVSRKPCPVRYIWF